jgi:hypothetical protein
MIKRILIVTVILFILYSAFVGFVAPTWWTASQHQWQDNVIKAEKFIYDTDSAENVIIGSSLSCRLAADSLPGVYNLSFAGQSIYDGLSILSHKKQVPKNIFIEMNVVLRKENEDFTSVLNSPVLYYPKKIIPSLRNDKQPLGVLGLQLNNRIVRKTIIKLKSFIPGSQNERDTKLEQQKMLQKLLDLKLQSYSKAPDPVLLAECFNRLKKDVTALEARGAHVVFFEMPVNYQLNSLEMATVIRETFYEKFPAPAYEYIAFPDSVSYETTDGMHLNKQEALSYTGYLRSRMKNYLH